CPMKSATSPPIQNLCSVGCQWLAMRTIMRAALRHTDFFDRRAAIQAGLAFPVVDQKMALRLALRAVGLAIPVDTRAFMLDAATQSRPDAFIKARDFVIAQRRGGTLWMNARPVQ